VPSPETVSQPSSWLFIKDKQSIWIERPRGRVLIVAGPGPTSEEREFISEQALDQYQMTLAEELANEGWFLFGVNRERRMGGERRLSDRGTADRRAANTPKP
jgi:hypothetical protein